MLNFPDMDTIPVNDGWERQPNITDKRTGRLFFHYKKGTRNVYFILEPETQRSHPYRVNSIEDIPVE